MRTLGKIFWLLLPGALGGCTVGPDYHAPQMTLPQAYAAAAAPAYGPTPPAPVADAAQWWKALHDETLDGLIDKAITANPELDIALMHVQEAREREDAALGTALPEVGASAGAARGTGNNLVRGRADQPLVSADNTSGVSHITQIYGFDAGWELDLFGQYRRAMEAARYDRQAAEAARSDVLISIIADLVRSYADLRGLQKQQMVLDQNIQVSARYTDFVKQRYDRGITNGLDLTLAQRELATLQAQRAPLAAQIGAAEYAIAVLCGEFPETMAKALSSPGPIPQLPAKLATGVPLELLRRRPDIAQAERELASSTARVGVATANLFPHIALTGGAGYQGQGLGVTPNAESFIWAVGPSVSLPILDFGTLDAQVNIADMHSRAMLMRYRETVLNAVKDVDTASGNYAAQQEQLRNLGDALTASQQAVSLATQRFDRGLTDSLNVIDAQRQQFELEQRYVAAQQAAAEQFVALYKALGSGWERYQNLPPAPSPQPALIAALRRS